MDLRIKDECNVLLPSSIFKVEDGISEDGISPSYCKSERRQDQENDKWHVPNKIKG